MKLLFACSLLLLNFIRAIITSGVATAVLIIKGMPPGQDGYVRFSYGDLSDNLAGLLGAMITLTPGTTLIAIDSEQRELELHFLDLRSREDTLHSIEQDFYRHLQTINGILS